MNKKTLLFTECVDLVGSACMPFDGAKKYVSTGAVDVDHISDSDTEVVDYTGKPSRANLEVKAGDVLFAKMQGTKKTLMIDPVLAGHIYSTGFCAVRAKNGILTDRCLYYLLTSDMFLSQKDKNCSGATQKAITNAGLGKIIIQVPSIDEQRDIADQLDAIKYIITRRQQELSALDDLIKARFIEMFDNKYPTVVLGDVIKTTSGGTPSKAHPEYYDGGTIPWLSSGEINAGVITSAKNYITEEGMRKSSAKMIPKDSVVVAMYGATAGVTGILKIETTTNQAVCSLLPTQQFIPEYLYYAVASKKDWMISQCQGGGQPNISQGIIRSMELIDAPLHEQGQFAAFVQQVDKSKVVWLRSTIRFSQRYGRTAVFTAKCI